MHVSAVINEPVPPMSGMIGIANELREMEWNPSHQWQPTAVPLVAHPAAEIFPALTGKALSSLTEDIRLNGLHESIWLHSDGRIIDGRNRYAACLTAGVEPTFRTWDGSGSLIAFVLSLNLHRRHLDESQRAMVGARAKPLFEEEARARQATSTGGANPHLSANLREAGKSGKTSEQAAAQVNVSPRLVDSAAKVIQSGTPELIAAVESGELSASAASQIAELSKDEQTELLTSEPEQIVAKAKEIRQAKRGAVQPATHEDASAEAEQVESESAVPGKREQMLRESAKKRMMAAMSSIDGICMGIKSIDVGMVIAACSEQELLTWAESAREGSAAIAAFGRKLKGGAK